MITQNTVSIQLPYATLGVLELGKKRHETYKLINDFYGPISRPVFSRDGSWCYAPLCDEDRAIIPKAALRRHAAIERAGFEIEQVIIGHEINISPKEPSVPTTRKSEIDWGNVADVAGKGLLIGITGIAMVPLFALAGLVMLIDPSYCVVLRGEPYVIELLKWSSEV